MSLSKTLAIILGAGPGTGAALGRAFASHHDVALLARSHGPLKEIADQINQIGAGEAVPFVCDASKPESIKSAFNEISQRFPNHLVKVAIFNVASPYVVKPFLELAPTDLETGLNINFLGAASFAKLALPKLLKAEGGNLIFTGATASLRGGAKFSAFAPSKFALRGLAQSLAREFGPQGVHVSHTIIDGLIDTERVKEFAGGTDEADSRLSPDAIADAYVFLADQHRSAWTQELDLRPFGEKF